MWTPRVVATYLSIGNDPEFSRSFCVAGQSSIGNFSSSADGGTGRHPVTNLTGDDLDQAHPGITFGAVVFPVFEITEERRDPDPVVSEEAKEFLDKEIGQTSQTKTS